MNIDNNIVKTIEKKYTVKEYARLKDVSLQTIYAKIKRNTIKHKTIEGKVYIIVNEVDTNIDNLKITDTTKLNDNSKQKLKIIKRENKKIKKQLKKVLSQVDKLSQKLEQKERYIKRLNKRLNNEKDQSITVLKQFITEQRALIHTPIKLDDEIVVNEVKKSKKKNKRDKR